MFVSWASHETPVIHSDKGVFGAHNMKQEASSQSMAGDTEKNTMPLNLLQLANDKPHNSAYEDAYELQAESNVANKLERGKAESVDSPKGRTRSKGAFRSNESVVSCFLRQVNAEPPKAHQYIPILKGNEVPQYAKKAPHLFTNHQKQ
eukprot:Platyproteum_vivax@DN536_c0_g1_i1.p1